MAIHNFQAVPDIQIERSVIDRSKRHSTTGNASYIIPIWWDEVLPGDTFRVKETIFMRLMTLISPLMDNIWVNTYYFWIPMRIVWDHTREFWGEQKNYAALTHQVAYSVPGIKSPANGASPITVHSVADYLGLPLNYQSGVGGNSNQFAQALPFRCYNKIYNRFFRDENLIDPASDLSNTDGPDAMEAYPLQKAAKFHDYFTSCLPWPQKGDAVTMPLGDSAPVYGNGRALGLTDGLAHNFSLMTKTGYANNATFETTGFNTAYGTTITGSDTGVATNRSIGLVGAIAGANGASGLYADLSEAIAATVSDMRLSVALQRMLEKDARFGTRYRERIKGHFNVDFIDTVYEPEYLGGGKSRVSINPVTKTYEDTGTNQVGELRATGTFAQHGHAFVKSFTEYGYVMGVMVIRGDLTYSQGLNKMWSRQLPEDFYDPSMAHIGEQPVLQEEIYNYNNPTYDHEIFGYQEPWAEYRYGVNQVSGLMRPGAPLALSSWNLSQKFDAPPQLNQEFIEDATPIIRVIAVTDQPQFKIDMHFDVQCARPMPLYSVPGLMDHF